VHITYRACFCMWRQNTLISSLFQLKREPRLSRLAALCGLRFLHTARILNLSRSQVLHSIYRMTSNILYDSLWHRKTPFLTYRILSIMADNSASDQTPLLRENSPHPQNLWTTREVADFLHVSIKTIFNLRKSGLPFVQLGGAIRFVPQEIEDYLAYSRRLSAHRLRQIIRKRRPSHD